MLKKPIDIAKEVIEIEIASIEKLSENLNDFFNQAVNLIFQTSSNGQRIIVTGMGKSGLVGQKIAASLASTGTPSFYLHAAEAVHGDLGMIQKGDLLLMLSHSGESNEILSLIPFLKANNNKIVSICGNPESTLAKVSDYWLNCDITQEACPHNLTPTSSTTNMMVLGDALVVALMQLNQISPQDFARFHPSGSLGKRLLTSVKEVMKTNIPRVQRDANLVEVVNQLTQGQVGCVLVFDDNEYEEKLYGIITDGDLRRAVNRHAEGCFKLKAIELSTQNPMTVSADMKLEEAKNLMNQKKITCLVVQDNEKVQGVIQIYQCEI